MHSIPIPLRSVDLEIFELAPSKACFFLAIIPTTILRYIWEHLHLRAGMSPTTYNIGDICRVRSAHIDWQACVHYQSHHNGSTRRTGVRAR